MSQVVYFIRLILWRVCLLCLLVLSTIALLYIFNPPSNGDQALVNSYSLITAILSVFVTVTIFKPEDTPLFEMSASWPKRFWNTIADNLILSWLGLLIIAGLLTYFASGYLKSFSPVLMLLAIIGYGTNIIFFGGITLLGTVMGRNSRIGLILGLLLFAAVLLRPGPRINPFSSPYKIAEGLDNIILWGIYRFIYFFIGVCCCIISLRWMQDTDRLLVGKLHQTFRLPPNKRKMNNWENRYERFLTFMSLPLPVPKFKGLGILIYETYITIRKGLIPIFIIVLGIGFEVIWGVYIALTSTFSQMLQAQATDIPRTLRYFLICLLPFVLVETISIERRTRVNQMMLSLISPRNYLTIKLIGTFCAIFFPLLISILPTLLIFVIVALFSQSFYIVAYLGLLFTAFIPELAYISTLSVLVGVFSRSNRPFILGGIVSIGILALFISTLTNVIGNVIFPFGEMAMDTISYWIINFSGINYLSEVQGIVVPFVYLLLPVISAGMQILLFWFIASKVLEREEII